jgi:hypothetical protein
MSTIFETLNLKDFSVCLPSESGEEIMKTDVIAYLAFGTALVGLFGVIIAFYYSKKRHSKVEEAKYKMLDDD